MNAAKAAPTEWKLTTNSTKRWERLFGLLAKHEKYFKGPRVLADGKYNETRLFKYAKKLWGGLGDPVTLVSEDEAVQAPAGAAATREPRFTNNCLIRLASVVVHKSCATAMSSLLGGSTRCVAAPDYSSLTVVAYRICAHAGMSWTLVPLTRSSALQLCLTAASCSIMSRPSTRP